jgi:hypothetical protein
MSNGIYKVTLNSTGHAASATIDFNAPSMALSCLPHTVCSMGFHHNIPALKVDNVQRYKMIDIVSDCTVTLDGHADFALHSLTPTSHLGPIVAEWLFKPTTAGNYDVTDDFQQTPGSDSSVTAGMSGTAKH